MVSIYLLIYKVMAVSRKNQKSNNAREFTILSVELP